MFSLPWDSDKQNTEISNEEVSQLKKKSSEIGKLIAQQMI